MLRVFRIAAFGLICFLVGSIVAVQSAPSMNGHGNEDLPIPTTSCADDTCQESVIGGFDSAQKITKPNPISKVCDGFYDYGKYNPKPQTDKLKNAPINFAERSIFGSVAGNRFKPEDKNAPINFSKQVAKQMQPPYVFLELERCNIDAQGAKLITTQILRFPYDITNKPTVETYRTPYAEPSKAP